MKREWSRVATAFAARGVVIAFAIAGAALPGAACWVSGQPRRERAVATQPEAAQQSQDRAGRDRRDNLTWSRPRFTERQRDRDRMVDDQLANPGPGAQPVRDERVLSAMRAVPRHRFVPAERRDQAYADCALPIGHEQTISQPYIVAVMTELLALKPGDKVLEIGTGSGYQAAVLAELTPHVFSIEILEPLYTRTTELLKELGYTTIKTRLGDGYKGWPEESPFDAIIVTCGADEVPEPLWEQLKPGGRMLIPVGITSESQRLQVITKREDGSRETKSVLPVRFVPMTGEGDKR